MVVSARTTISLFKHHQMIIATSQVLDPEFNYYNRLIKNNKIATKSHYRDTGHRQIHFIINAFYDASKSKKSVI